MKKYRIKYMSPPLGFSDKAEGWAVQEKVWWGWKTLTMTSGTENARKWLEDIANTNYEQIIRQINTQ